MNQIPIPSEEAFAFLTEIQEHEEAESAWKHLDELYRQQLGSTERRLTQFRNHEETNLAENGCYPFVGISVGPELYRHNERLAYGNLPHPGSFGVTITNPLLFKTYYLQQFQRLLRYGRKLVTGVSPDVIPLPFATDSAGVGLSRDDASRLHTTFHFPNLAHIDDTIVDEEFEVGLHGIEPLSLFQAERVDLSLMRLRHYTGTEPRHFQRFVLFTNYQRYVEEFIEWGIDQVRNGDTYREFVQPGNVVEYNPRFLDRANEGKEPRFLPQMPAYHAVSEGHSGITMINIGVGPSNTKTITDHVAVLRPHVWLMLGHCGGLRRTQKLGDYVLAHAYVRKDHVLDEMLPLWIPLPAIAEVQVPLAQAVCDVTGMSDRDVKQRLRTGTVYTCDDRNWELRHSELSKRFSLSRAVAIDMESATVAANGVRFRVPYGTLLCVSDRPLHGEIKLPGMANDFYAERVAQHLTIGLKAIELIKKAGVESLHSRKLRSFSEPGFR